MKKYFNLQWFLTDSRSFFCSCRYSNFYSPASPTYIWFSNSSMNSVFSRIILLFLYRLWCLSCRIRCFFINTNTFSIENSFLSGFLDEFTSVRAFLWFRLFIIKWWSEINFDVCVDDANGFILILWLNLHDIDFEFPRERWNSYSVTFVKAGKISQLILQNCFWVIKLNKFCFVGSKFDEVRCFHSFIP